MKENVVFIAGGAWQKPFVQYLKNKGHFVSVVNPVETETTSIADHHIKADVNDLQQINKHIESLQPIFITSDQSDISTKTVAALSEKWNLPGNSVDVIDRFTNKYSIYSFAKSIGVSVPESILVNHSDDVQSFARLQGYPVIIKPTDATMSRGFRKIDCPSDITLNIFESSLRFSKSRQIISQTFIPGEMVTLEGVCSGGKHKTIATSQKDGYFLPGINCGVRYPCVLPIIEEIIAANDRYVELAGLKFGLTHSEYIVNADGYWLIEIGARGGGAGIANKIVPWVSGIDVYDIFYESLIGNIIDVKSLSPLNRMALLKYYHEDSMTFCNENKASIIQTMPGVASFHYNFIGKQYISDNYDKRHTMGIYLAETKQEIDRIVDDVDKVIQSQ
jgi:biotin carboxylase